jgi:DNA-binding NarL/FixJ family response regulator
VTACRIAIFEDDPVYRAGLVLLFGSRPGFSVACEAESPDEAIAGIAGGEPAPWDLALMDLDMPGEGGIAATRKLKAARPELRVLVLTVFDEPATILEAICAGADGYLLKRASHEELIAQVRSILDGGAPLTPRVARTVLALLRDRGVARHMGAPLSPREQQVLAGFVDGKSYKQVAADLGIQLDTVRTYVRTLYKKLQVNSVSAAVTAALRQGLV